jgi:hypothetical protein
MSRFSEMPATKRRAWIVGSIALFVLMCAAIGYSQWYAIHVNIPRYDAQKSSQP